MGLLSSLLFFNAGLWPSRAADRLEVEIDDVVLPVKVSDLGAWVRSEGKSRSELKTWLLLLDEDILRSSSKGYKLINSKTAIMQIASTP